MNIKELKEHWELEKEQYKTSEVGSGVQKFVKEILLCTGIFNLNAGKLSTELKDRKNEFIEEAKKKGHRADVVIFIDRDIIIPVEIEKFKSIKSGEKQIIQYQTDWQKKLGLLTDGFEWRFYNNLYVEKTFTIESILNKPELFLEFWSEYTKPETYYRSFFAKQGQLQLFEYPPPNIDDVRQDFFIDITHLIESFKNKLNLKGYFKKEKDETGKHKKTVEITYAYLIQFILYKTLVDNAFETFEDDWKERIKNIDKALQAGIYGDILLKIKGISDKISEKIYKRFNDEQLIINERLQEIMQMPNQQIGDVSVWLDILLFIHRYNFANVQNEIFGYVYENYLKDLYLDEKKGQYFTDPLVVEFMLNEMVYSKENLKKRFTKKQDSISIIDPSCGSGTFLYNATVRLVDSFFENTDSSAKLTEKLINENIFGLDIAEFPLYLAEMNILMRMLPIIIHEKYNNPVEQKIKVFKTRDSIAEFFDTSIRNTITDINKEYKEKGIQYNIFTQVLNLGYDSFMRDKGDLDDLKKSLETRNSLPRYRFDYVVGNPPYVSYNECASQKVLIFELMKEGKIKLNDIYGFNLHSTPNNTKKYRPNPNLYAFFMALGVALLKDDGVISYIIPQTILTAGDLDVIRYHIASFLTIEKIVLFENKMFIGRGIQQSKPIATSSLIFILKKTTPSHGHKVKVIRYTKTDKDVKDCLTEITNRRNVVELEVSQKILLKNHENWNFLNFNNDIIELIDFYNKNTDDFSNYYTHLISKFYFNSKFIFDGGYSIDENCRLYSEPAEDYYIYPKFIGNTYSHVIANGYWPNHRKEKQSHFIALRQASQEYLLLDSKFKIVWSYANPHRFYFTDKKIIWARNQFNAIGSNNETELFYLFALLNSGLNFFLLRNYLRSNNEKDLLFSITSIKKFVRIPELISLLLSI
ncbi:MAG: N-6 DNA methylase [Bacteroidia bacterium]|nr:N-6 DNA methylase [Bacteroidia bacterium]